MEMQNIKLEIWQIVLLVAVIIWDVTLRGFGLWRAARNDQRGWFIALLILNTLGILPLIYLLLVQDRTEEK